MHRSTPPSSPHNRPYGVTSVPKRSIDTIMWSSMRPPTPHVHPSVHHISESSSPGQQPHVHVGLLTPLSWIVAEQSHSVHRQRQLSSGMEYNVSHDGVYQLFISWTSHELIEDWHCRRPTTIDCLGHAGTRRRRRHPLDLGQTSRPPPRNTASWRIPVVKFDHV